MASEKTEAPKPKSRKAPEGIVDPSLLEIPAAACARDVTDPTKKALVSDMFDATIGVARERFEKACDAREKDPSVDQYSPEIKNIQVSKETLPNPIVSAYILDLSDSVGKEMVSANQRMNTELNPAKARMQYAQAQTMTVGEFYEQHMKNTVSVFNDQRKDYVGAAGFNKEGEAKDQAKAA